MNRLELKGAITKSYEEEFSFVEKLRCTLWVDGTGTVLEIFKEKHPEVSEEELADFHATDECSEFLWNLCKRVQDFAGNLPDNEVEKYNKMLKDYYEGRN